MRLITKSFITTISLIFLLWILISWADVVSHNNPFIDDGDPHWWNAFEIILQEAE